MRKLEAIKNLAKKNNGIDATGETVSQVLNEMAEASSGGGGSQLETIIFDPDEYKEWTKEEQLAYGKKVYEGLSKGTARLVVRVWTTNWADGATAKSMKLYTDGVYTMDSRYDSSLARSSYCGDLFSTYLEDPDNTYVLQIRAPYTMGYGFWYYSNATNFDNLNLLAVIPLVID